MSSISREPINIPDTNWWLSALDVPNSSLQNVWLHNWLRNTLFQTFKMHSNVTQCLFRAQYACGLQERSFTMSVYIEYAAT